MCIKNRSRALENNGSTVGYHFNSSKTKKAKNSQSEEKQNICRNKSAVDGAARDHQQRPWKVVILFVRSHIVQPNAYHFPFELAAKRLDHVEHRRWNSGSDIGIDVGAPLTNGWMIPMLPSILNWIPNKVMLCACSDSRVHASTFFSLLNAHWTSSDCGHEYMHYTNESK